jgi:hypothetical protein
LIYWMGCALAFSLSGCVGSIAGREDAGEEDAGGEDAGGDDASCSPGTYVSASGCLPCTEAVHCGDPCRDCTALSTNHACVDGVCGCATPADCAPGDWCANGACSASSDIGLYVVPPIRDTRILPDSGPPATEESYEILMVAALGEYEPASFVVRPRADLSGLVVETTPLTSASGAVIPADNVDIRVVKAWWQAGVEMWGTEDRPKTFTPELLLKDDALIKVEGEENFLRLDGEYVQMSAWDSLPDWVIHTPADFPVQDSATLQPFDVPAGTNKQVWITIQVPADAAPGTYQGFILLHSSTDEIGRSVRLRIDVLPFSLAKPAIAYSIYYRGRLDPGWPEGSISSEYKSDTQLRAELKNMREHGVANPTVHQHYEWTDLLGKHLDVRRDLGMDNQSLYFTGMGTGNSSDPAELQALKQSVEDLVAFVAPYGVTDFYIYGIDEASGSALLAQQLAWQAVHEGGGKVFVAGYMGAGGNFDAVGDVQDLLVCAYAPSAEEAARWHGVRHFIFNYGNPQGGYEQPERYRRNYGLLLWQADYDGAMDFAYQCSFGSIWNDFDHGHYRDHVFAYPTVDGVIDTIQWDGFREGVDDVRYLTTLLLLLEEKKAEGKDTSFTETWLAQLKDAPLVDLDKIRARIIEHILYWRGEGPGCGNEVVEQGEVCDGDNIGDITCTDLGFSGGKLGCKEECVYDTCGCTPPWLSVAFSSPTPAAGAVVIGSEVRIDASLESSCLGASGFIDWNDSLTGYWDFNENSGATAADKSSHGRGCIVNGATWAEGKFGSALLFDGANDSVTCGDLGIPENGPATVEGWFNFTEFATDRGAAIPLVTGLYQNVENDELCHNQFFLSGTDDYFSVASLIRKNEWFHLALSYAGDTGTAKLYVNAVPVAFTVQGKAENIGALSSFRVGSDGGSSFNGLVDEVRVWNRVLAEDEIRASYDATRYGLHTTFGGLTDGPAHCYATVTNELGQSARTETRNFTIDAP